MNTPLMHGGASLYRSLAIPFSAFVLVTTLSVAAWLAWGNRQKSIQRLEQMAATNADFIDELGLPHSQILADKLSIILGVAVRFDSHAARPRQSTNWPQALPPARRALALSAPSSEHIAGYDLATAPIPESDDILVLARRGQSGWAGEINGGILVPTATVTVACGALALLMAHRIVRPLGTLTDWLPNLHRQEAGANPMPASVSERGDEIGLLARALQETRDRLVAEQTRRQQSERLAALGSIATSLAHEIRNPVAAIRMHSDLLAQETADEPALKLIRDEADQVADLINQWLFVARPAPPETRVHDLGELVTRVGNRLQAAMDYSETTLTVTADRHTRIDCDRPRMEQVVRNLLVNAMQAMPEGGEIRVRLQADDGQATLTIRDGGTGFSEEALERFGEPFFSEREGGMGIGLTLAGEVVAAHHGQLEVMNHPNGGTVRIRLPLAKLES